MSPHRIAVALAVAACALLALAPSASAWWGDIEVRKVNVGGPASDTFTFKVEARRAAAPAWTLLPATDYTGLPFGAKAEPDNPFVLHGAPSAAGPFTRIGAAPTAARFADIDAAGEAALPPPALRDWRGVRVTETATPPGYRTTSTCGVTNIASGAAWTPALDAAWGPWAATPTTAGGGPGIETTLRWLPAELTVAPEHRGPWVVTCTFTNTYRARVKVLKRFVAPVNGQQRVDITVGGADVDTSGGAESFADGDASDWIAVDGGSDVALTERGAAGTVMTDYDATLECRSGSDGAYGAWVVVPGGTSGTLTGVQPGRDYECRFTNTGRPPGGGVATGTPTPGGGTVTPSGGTTTPSGTPVPRRATARAIGNAGCITSRYATADVRGRGIASVAFRINGKRRTQLTAPNVAGMFRLRVAASSLPPGASRVTAYVRFQAGTGVAPKLLTLAWSRCPRRTGAPPRYTG